MLPTGEVQFHIRSTIAYPQDFRDHSRNSSSMARQIVPSDGYTAKSFWTEIQRPKGPGRSLPSRPFAISTKNKHLLLSRYLAIPTHGFTVVLSVFGGTPSTKPLKFKSTFRLGVSGSDPGPAWAHHAGDDSMLVFAIFSFALSDITWMSPYYRSLVSFRLSLMVIKAIKNPAYVSVSRVWEILIVSLPAYLSIQVFVFLTDVRHG